MNPYFRVGDIVYINDLPEPVPRKIIALVDNGAILDGMNACVKFERLSLSDLTPEFLARWLFVTSGKDFLPLVEHVKDDLGTRLPIFIDKLNELFSRPSAMDYFLAQGLAVKYSWNNSKLFMSDVAHHLVAMY